MVNAFLIHVEPEGDFFFTPEGILITIDNLSYQVYSLDSRHNFLRAAVTKFPLDLLQGEGVTYRGAQIKLEPIRSIDTKIDKAKATVFSLLSELYLANPERYFFLGKLFKTPY